MTFDPAAAATEPVDTRGVQEAGSSEVVQGITEGSVVEPDSVTHLMPFDDVQEAEGEETPTTHVEVDTSNLQIISQDVSSSVAIDEAADQHSGVLIEEVHSDLREATSVPAVETVTMKETGAANEVPSEDVTTIIPETAYEPDWPEVVEDLKEQEPEEDTTIAVAATTIFLMTDSEDEEAPIFTSVAPEYESVLEGTVPFHILTTTDKITEDAEDVIRASNPTAEVTSEDDRPEKEVEETLEEETEVSATERPKESPMVPEEVTDAEGTMITVEEEDNDVTVSEQDMLGNIDVGEDPTEEEPAEESDETVEEPVESAGEPDEEKEGVSEAPPKPVEEAGGEAATAEPAEPSQGVELVIEETEPIGEPAQEPEPELFDEHETNLNLTSVDEIEEVFGGELLDEIEVRTEPEEEESIPGAVDGSPPEDNDQMTPIIEGSEGDLRRPGGETQQSTTQVAETEPESSREGEEEIPSLEMTAEPTVAQEATPQFPSVEPEAAPEEDDTPREDSVQVTSAEDVPEDFEGLSLNSTAEEVTLTEAPPDTTDEASPGHTVEVTTKYIVEYNNGNFPDSTEKPYETDVNLLGNNGFPLEEQENSVSKHA